MDKPKPLVRYGDGVYRGATLIAAWMRGAWYTFQDGPAGKREWVHLDPRMSEQNAQLVEQCGKAPRSTGL